MRASGPTHPIPPAARERRARPDPTPLRLLAGVAGVASASAILTALLPSVTPVAADAGPGAGVVADAVPAPPVRHVTRYVTLQPGQTAPPSAPVVVQPTPTPRVHVVTVTRQSGKP
jgi:hypothetical protein